MTGSAGTAFVDLQPRFGGGWTSAVVKEAETAGAAGSQALGGFASKTGGVFQTLDRQLAGFGVPLTGQLSTIGSHLQGIDTEADRTSGRLGVLKEVGTAAFIGVAAAAVGLGAVSAKAFLEGQDATATYDQALKNVGESQDELTGKLESTVKTMAKYGYENDAVELSAATLTRATKDGAKALELEGLAADLAAGRHIDLSSATGILAKVETGHVALLGRLGIATKDAAGNTITQEEAIRRLTALYGGSAASASKTYAGELRALGAEAHNLEEELGGKIVPFVLDLGKGLLDGVHAIETINSATGGWLGTLAEVVVVGGGIAVVVSKVGSGLESLGGLLGVATGLTTEHAAAETADAAATGAATEAMAASGVAAAEEGAAVGALTGSLVGATAATEGLAAAQGGLAASEGAAGIGAIGAQAAGATAGVAGLVAGEGEAAAGAGLLSGALGLLGPALAVAGGGFLLGKKLGGELNDVLGGTKPNVDELASSLGDLAKTQEIGGATASDFGDHLQTLSGDLKTIQGSTIEKGFGFAPSAHQAVKDISAVNDALKSLLITKGPDAATEAFAQLSSQLLKDGTSAEVVGRQFSPFLDALDQARSKARDTAAASSDLGASLASLTAKGGPLDRQSAQLSIADAFDSVRTAEEALTQARADEAGTGQNAINAAQQETSARQSLTSALDSETQASISLGDAREKLAQFNGPVDTQIRSLQRTQIEDRVVTTPEEARQKEIDLLTFDENSANTRESLQKQVASAEHGVEQATDGVANAQAGVSKAADARRKVQTDAAQAVRDGERKVAEATIAVATQLQKAATAGQINNTQLQAYLTLLDLIAKTTDPKGVLAKNLDGIVEKMRLAGLTQSLGFVPGYGSSSQPEGPPAPVFVPPGYGSTNQPEGPPAPGTHPVVTQGPPSTPQPVHIESHQVNHFHGTDIPTTTELDVLNRKQAIRLSVAGSS